MRRILLPTLVIAVAGLAGWCYYAQRATRRELLEIRDAITPGMTREEAVRTIRQKVRRTSLAPGSAGDQILVVTEGPSPVLWVLCVSFNENRAVAVRIGTEDSLYERPKSAPPDLVWGPEASGSPWHAARLPPERR